MKIRAIKTSIFQEKENLLNFLAKNLPKIKEKEVVVITSKIVALSEGRVAEIKNEKTRERLIRAESQWAMKTRYAWLTIKDNMVMAAAGVDESNANGKIILLPRDSFEAADKIRRWLRKKYQIKEVGVVITDSRMLPLKSGIVGVALGYAGFKGLRDYRGEADLFGRKLKLSRTDVADSLAAAAVLVMGEGAERQPLAVIEKVPVQFMEKINRQELAIDVKDDLYRPIFENVSKIRLRKRKDL